MKNFVLTLISIFVVQVLIAQTEPTQHYGCKFIHNNLRNTELTQREIQYSEDLLFRSDTFDIINYDIQLEVTDFSTKVLRGKCTIDFTPKMEGLEYILFDLLEMSVDSVFQGDNRLEYEYSSPFLKVFFDDAITTADTSSVTIYYHGVSVIDPSGFGGFQFEGGYAYNLGIGLESIPHNYGRSWFPCFDNFVERSTYGLHIITKPNHKAYCVGDFAGVDTLSDGKTMYHYYMNQLLPTYLVGVAVSNYEEVNWEYEGIERTIPMQLLSKPEDTTNIKRAFAYLPFAVEALEKWFGPYEWSRVGYVMTTRGAMEHPTNVAFPDFIKGKGDPEEAMGTMVHELAHHWWGDITTLTTAYDMWIKEGTSEYGKHLFIEDFFGKERFLRELKSNQYKVLDRAHIEDDGYRALSGMPMNHTYGVTTYNKGAFVIHNLRTYMGDELFKQGMRSILEKYKYSHLDAAQFEAQLEENTGLNLECFFNDWIYAPGFNAFEIDSMIVEDNNKVKLYIEQKLHHAPHYHCDVPLEFTFYDADLNKIVKTAKVSGQFYDVEFDLDFYPKFCVINENQKLNNGQIGNSDFLKNNEEINHLNLKIIKIAAENLGVDSFYYRVEHIYGACDTLYDNEDIDMQISSTHFWNFTGDFPENNSIKVVFPYRGEYESSLDYELTNKTEKKVQVVFKPENGKYWELIKDYQKNTIIPKDGYGIITITGLKAGKYALANIEKTSEISEIASELSVYPNPSKDFLHIDISKLNLNSKLMVNVYSHLGKRVLKKEFYGNDIIDLDIKSLENGIYYIKLVDDSNNDVFIREFVKID